MIEEWRDIAGYEGAYQVSNLGRVRSLDHTVEVVSALGKPFDRRVRGKIRATSVNSTTGYVQIVLTSDGENFMLHRLVAAAFHPNPENLPEVNHKDGNRGHNAATNLEWVSSSENKNHSYRELKRKQHAWTSPVVLSDANSEFQFPSILAAAKHLGVDHGSINSALKRNHRCRGYQVRLQQAA